MKSAGKLEILEKLVKLNQIGERKREKLEEIAENLVKSAGKLEKLVKLSRISGRKIEKLERNC